MGVVSIVLVLVVLYLYQKWHYLYWKRRGLPYLKPDLFFGNTKEYALQKLSFAEQFTKLYNELKAKGAKHGGIFMMFQPTYIPIDLDIVKCILQKDFPYFESRGIYVNEEVDPLTGNLFNLEGEKWKTLRAKITPTFTSGKLKMMLSTMMSCGNNLKDVIQESAAKKIPIDIKELSSSYTIDSIGNVGFGIDVQSLKNPECEFRDFGISYFRRNNMMTLVKVFMSLVVPKTLLTMIRYKVVDRYLENFFMGVIRSTVEFREKNNEYKKDFMHLLLQLKNRGKLSDDKLVMGEEKIKGSDYITFNELAAQCFVFFLAGYETSASTMTCTLLELALNQDIQNKLREEIVTISENINYDTIMGMKYMDKVIYETIRKYANGVGSMRICNTTYKVPNTDVTLEVGTRVMIPFRAIQWDPDHFPNPEKFDPERFNEENKAKRHPFAFLPFGEGQRKCLAWRVGMLQLKVGLISIIKNFKITLNEQTKLPLKSSVHSITHNFDGDIWLDVEEL